MAEWFVYDKSVYSWIFLFFLSAVDPATAVLKEGKKTPREGFLALPQFQIFVSAEG